MSVVVADGLRVSALLPIEPEQLPAAVSELIRAKSAELEKVGGRLVVRYSGTEALARVMVEAESEAKMEAATAAIAAEIQKALGH